MNTFPLLRSFRQLLYRYSMYRLMLYGLLAIYVGTIILSGTKLLPYNPIDILVTGIALAVVCGLSNWALAKFFNAVTNLESAYITALIITLIFGPLPFTENFGVIIFVGVVAMASKYVAAIHRRHLFNPAAIALLLTGLFWQLGASWWVGGAYTLPLILVVGIIVATRARRWLTLLGFAAVYLGLLAATQTLSLQGLLYSPIWFFMFIMLTEPITSPAVGRQQLAYGGGTALLYWLLPQVASSYPFSLETALVVANALYFVYSPRAAHVLRLARKEQLNPNTWAFYFTPTSPLRFTPGQFIELTSPHSSPDAKGMRRFVSIASAPSDPELMVAFRVSQQPSSFKQSLLNLKTNQSITASHAQGDFVAPKDLDHPLAFIAGGIGITPFHSILTSLNSARHNIAILYANASDDIPFKSDLDHLNTEGLTIHYHNTSQQGVLSSDLIAQKIPDYATRTFYVSGPPPMVDAVTDALRKLKVKKIKTDYFDGYATP